MKLYRWAMGIAISATIMSTTGEALASTGCDGVNTGVFNRTNYTPPGSGVLNTQTGFEVGDTINFTVSGLTGSSFQLINGALNTALLDQPLSNAPASLSYRVTGGNSDTTLNTYMLVQAIPYEISITATCTPAPVPVPPQPQPSEDLSRERSGEVAKAFVMSRINTLMLNQPSGISLRDRSAANRVGIASSSLFTLNFDRTTDSPYGIGSPATINRNPSILHAEQLNAFGANSRDSLRGGQPIHLHKVLSDTIRNLGLASNHDEKQVTPARFDAWIEGYYTGFDYDRIGSDSNGHSFVGYIGTDYRISDSLLIGTLAQLDSTRETSDMLISKVDGNGWMAGPYLSARLHKNIFLDLRAAGGSSSSNDLETANVTADFDTTRWLVFGRISGDWHMGHWRLTPTTSVAYIEENLKSYTESTGARVSGQSISLGQAAFGPEIGYNTQIANMEVQPYGSIKGIWNFDRPDGPLVNAQLIGIGPYWGQISSFWGRVGAGVGMLMPTGPIIRFGLNYDGLGDNDYQSLTCQGQLSIPLD